MKNFTLFDIFTEICYVENTVIDFIYLLMNYDIIIGKRI